MALSGTQLDASTSVPGSFSYSPVAGTVLVAGDQTLKVHFTPTDTTNYEAATATVQIDVTYIVTAPGMGGRPMESTSTQSETWIYSKGDWYFLTHHGHGDWEGRPASLLPVHWVEGWPIIGKVGDDGIGTMVWGGEKPVQGMPVVVPQSSDDFNGPKLGLQWEWNYQPRKDKWSLTEHPGFLRLHAWKPLRPDQLKTAGNTLTQRSMRTPNNVATLAMDISGTQWGPTSCSIAKRNTRSM